MSKDVITRWLLEKEGVKDNFTDYPLRDVWLLEFREKIIDLLK